MEYCANLSDSLPNLDSLPQYCGMLSWLLSDSDSAYFSKNMSFSGNSDLYLQARDRTCQCSGAVMLSLMHGMSSDEI